MSARPSRLGASLPQTLGLELVRVALRREVSLSDYVAGELHLRTIHPSLNLNDVSAGRRLAIDTVVDAARHPETRPVCALRAAADLAERALTHAHTEADHLAGWRRMSEMLDRALAELAS